MARDAIRDGTSSLQRRPWSFPRIGRWLEHKLEAVIG